MLYQAIKRKSEYFTPNFATHAETVDKIPPEGCLHSWCIAM